MLANSGIRVRKMSMRKLLSIIGSPLQRGHRTELPSRTERFNLMITRTALWVAAFVFGFGIALTGIH